MSGQKAQDMELSITSLRGCKLKLSGDGASQPWDRSKGETTTKYWWGCEATATPGHWWWEGKINKPLGKALWQFIITLNGYLPYDLMAESKQELKSLLMRVKEESAKAGLKLSIQKTKIVESSPITSWQIDEKQWKQWQILFSWAPKSLWTVTTATKLKDACSLEENLWQI